MSGAVQCNFEITVALPPLGILMLDTQFARPLGDAGTAASWPIPVLIVRVTGAHAQPTVLGNVPSVEPFVTAGRHLIERGAIAITSTCGFLIRQQWALAEVFAVPTALSALSHFSTLAGELAPHGKRVAILTIRAAAIDAVVRSAASIPDDALVFDLPESSHFVRSIFCGDVALDVERARAEWVSHAVEIKRQHPSIGTWLFECANMPPYRDAIAQATNLPVYDALSHGIALHAAALRNLSARAR